MSELWFTADTHFGHGNIIQFCDRPFQTLREMNETMVAAWNGCVGPRDIVLHLGDVMMGLTEELAPLLASLHGRKLLIVGNHDTKPRRVLFRSLGWEMAAQLLVNDVLMQHRYVEGDHAYEAVIHGHAHGTCRLARHHDMGVDVGGWELGGRPIPVPCVLSRRDEFTLRLLLKALYGWT